MKRPIVAVLVLVAGNVFAAQREVGTAREVAAALAHARPGDVLVMKDGNWADQVVDFKATGGADSPITLRAQTPGKVVLSGQSSVVMEGDNLVLSGIFLDRASGDGDGIVVHGDHNRITDCAVVDGQFKFFVHLFGSDNRVDHCYLAGKRTDQPTLQIEVEEKRPNHDEIDHNHFGPRPPLGHNGGETMRVGYSYQSMFSSGAVVEENLYDRCDGELEIISSKSCDNIYRHNTFLDCDGMLTLRHGNRCMVDGNFFIGHNKPGSGGIRVIGEDHVIINNYLEGLTKGAFWITGGMENSPLNGYFRAQRCLIAFNTVYESKGPYIDLWAGMGSDRHKQIPLNITIANNLFVAPIGEKLLSGKEDASYRWMGNIAAGGELADHPGVKSAEVGMVHEQGGIWRPIDVEVVQGAAKGDFPNIKTDIDGQPRTGKLDVGCDQISDAPIKYRPLTGGDVGPRWMSVGQREQYSARKSQASEHRQPN